MLARELITDTIPPLKTSDTGLKALSWMDEFKVKHLPIVNKETLLGIITEEDIMSLNAPEEPLGNHALSLLRPFVFENQHVFEVIKLVSKLGLSLIPVIDDQNLYKGVICLPDLVRGFAEITSVDNPGGIITLELNVNDYLCSEIVQIIESNDARILSLYIAPHHDSNKMDLTIKINKTDLTRILATFYRYHYTVKATFQENEFGDDMRERFDSLMNYLNI